MSGVGFSELIILALIGLIVLGPERLPRVASQIGRWLGQARRMTRVMRRQLEDELDFEKELTIRPPTKQQQPGDDDVSPRSDEWSKTVDGGETNPPTNADIDAAAENSANKTAAENDEKDA